MKPKLSLLLGAAITGLTACASGGGGAPASVTSPGNIAAPSGSQSLNVTLLFGAGFACASLGPPNQMPGATQTPAGAYSYLYCWAAGSDPADLSAAADLGLTSTTPTQVSSSTSIYGITAEAYDHGVRYTDDSGTHCLGQCLTQSSSSTVSEVCSGDGAGNFTCPGNYDFTVSSREDYQPPHHYPHSRTFRIIKATA